MSFMLLTMPSWGEDMGTHRATYEINLEDIMLDHSKKLNELPNKYVVALVALKAKFQKEGSLTKIKKILAEMERFEKTKAMAQGTGPNELLEIRNLQTAYSKHVLRLKKDRASGIISLTNQYDRALGNYQKTLVQAGKFDDANKVEEERKRAKKSAIYLRAKETLSRSEKETVAPVIVNLANPLRPIDAKRFDGHWYKFYPSNGPWIAAKQKCEEMNGYLVCIETEKERKWLVKLLDRGVVSWVGGKDTKKEGQPLWLNGKPVLLKVYNNTKQNDYLGMNGQGTFNFRPRDGFVSKMQDVVGFICEWDK